MKSNRYHARLNLQSSIFLIVFMIGLIVILLMTMMLHSIFSERLQQDMMEVYLSNAQHIAASLDSRILAYRARARLIYKNNHARLILQTGATGWTESNERVASLFRQEVGSDSNIVSAFLFNPDKICYITQNLVASEESLQALHEALLVQVPGSVVFFSLEILPSFQKKPVLTVFFGLGSKRFTETGMALNLDVERLAEQILPELGDGEHVILNAEKQIVMSRRNENFGKKFLLEEAFEPNVDEKSGYFKTQHGGQAAFAAYAKTQGGLFTVVSVIPQTVILRETSAIRETLLVMLSAIGLFILIAMVLASAVSRPVSHVLNRFFKLSPKVQRSLQTHKTHIGLTLHEVMTSFKEMEMHLNSERTVRFLTRHEAEVPECDWAQSSGHAIAVVVLENYQTLAGQELGSLLIRMLPAIVMGSVEDMSARVFRIRDDEYVAVLFGWSDSFGEGDLEQCMVALKNALVMELELTVSIGVSQMLSNISQDPDGYEQARRCVAYRLFHEPCMVVTAALESKLGFWKDENAADCLVNAVKQGAQAKLPALIDSFLDSLSTCCLEEAQSAIVRTVLRISGLKMDIHATAGHLPEETVHCLKRIQSLCTRAQLTNYLQEMSQCTIDQMNITRSTNTDSLMTEALEYIQRAFSDTSLSVNLMAAYTGISVSYFSRLFNETTGLTFPEYLMRVRMQKASEKLIAEQDKDISQIGIECGFNSQSYFSKSFRKMYGITPTQYRAKFSQDRIQRL